VWSRHGTIQIHVYLYLYLHHCSLLVSKVLRQHLFLSHLYTPERVSQCLPGSFKSSSQEVYHIFPITLRLAIRLNHKKFNWRFFRSFCYSTVAQLRVTPCRWHIRRSAMSVGKVRASLPQLQVGVRVQHDPPRWAARQQRASVPRPPTSHTAERQPRHWLLCQRQHQRWLWQVIARNVVLVSTWMSIIMNILEWSDFLLRDH